MPRHPPCALYCLTTITCYFRFKSDCIALQSLFCWSDFYHSVFVHKEHIHFCICFYFRHFCRPRMSCLYLQSIDFWYLTFFHISVFGFQGTSLECFTHSVETERFELLTPCLQGRCSPNWATPPLKIWQPPTFPYRLQHSIIGRLRLNLRVRDENGCVP